MGGSLVIQLVLYCSYNYNMKILLFEYISAVENSNTNIYLIKEFYRAKEIKEDKIQNQ